MENKTSIFRKYMIKIADFFSRRIKKKNKVLSYKEYSKWLIEQTSSFEDFVAKVAIVTAATHPGDHGIVESEQFPGTCVCGWIYPQTQVSDCPCGKTLAEHIVELPRIIDESMTVRVVMEATNTGQIIVIEI